MYNKCTWVVWLLLNLTDRPKSSKSNKNVTFSALCQRVVPEGTAQARNHQEHDGYSVLTFHLFNTHTHYKRYQYMLELTI